MLGWRGAAAAAFDTRISKPRLPGSAARAAEKRLRRLGFRVVAPAASYYVEGTTGPLVEGERERARRWGELLRARTHAAAAVPDHEAAAGQPSRRPRQQGA